MFSLWKGIEHCSVHARKCHAFKLKKGEKEVNLYTMKTTVTNVPLCLGPVFFKNISLEN
uniref:Uncharacterized protein n=1 Tax=Anguilla anguilla TaxID=7936 RepID=A0A0E9S3K0_ANGAN